MRNSTTTVGPNRSLLGRMSPAERAMGRFMRNPEEHRPAPVVHDPEPTLDPEPKEVKEAKTELVDDDKARLIKDTMRHKAAAREAQSALEEARALLAKYEGIDPEKAQEIVSAQKAAELKAAEDRGEYERIVEQMRTQHNAENARVNEAAEKAASDLAAANQKIDDLTVGRAFGDSKFITQKTVLSAAKARVLYGSHVELVEGEMVVYDKPKGAKERTPLVDVNGQYLSFEAGIEKVIRADPDFETIGRATIKPGAGSVSAPVKPGEPKVFEKSGRSRIANALSASQNKK